MPHAELIATLHEVAALVTPKGNAGGALPRPACTHVKDVGLKIKPSTSKFDGQQIAIPVDRKKIEELAGR